MITQDKFLPYAQQHISQEDQNAICEAISRPQITRGELVEEFEEAMAEFCGASYAVAFQSGTAALMAAYAAVDTGPYDRIVSTPNTFVATVGGAVQRAAVPLFTDIDASNGNIDVTQIAEHLDTRTSRGKIIIAPVHFAGIPVDTRKIDSLIKDPSTVVIEDAAHALGSSYEYGGKVGSCAHSAITIFSFHPAKTMTTTEGGMATTNDPEIYRKLRLYRNNGIEKDPQYLKDVPGPWYYEVKELSGNYNFTEVQAALGLSQLRRIDTFIKKRQKLVSAYAKRLENTPHIRLLRGLESPLVSPHLCVALIDFSTLKKDRASVMHALHNMGIGTQVHYIPLYRFPVFQKQKTELPEMEKYYSQALSLPLYFTLEEEDVERVVRALKDVLAIK